MKSALKIEPVYLFYLLLSALWVCLIFRYGQGGRVAIGVSVALLLGMSAGGGYIYRRIERLDTLPYIRVAYILVAMFIMLDGVLAVYAVAYGDLRVFMLDFPLYLTASVTAWAYIIRGESLPVTDEADDIPAEMEAAANPASAPPDKTGEPGMLTVKKGSRIHIISTDDIIHISAMGDYVAIVTISGRYVKEGTMVYYENMLTEGFVRIHRSTIVNISRIGTYKKQLKAERRKAVVNQVFG